MGPTRSAGCSAPIRSSFFSSLPRPPLPVFEGFDAAETAEILAVASILELPRGQSVFSAGQPSSACFIVVRGAVEIRARHERRERRMAVLGPGQLLGYMSALEKSAHGSDAIV